MLKHCHNSSIRLQRRCHGGMVNPDTVSLNSTLTVHSSCGSSESNTSDSVINSSFQIISDDQCYGIGNNNYERNVYNQTPDPPMSSLSSRASSYVSLADSGPKTTVKVYASCLRPDIEYKTLSIGNTTTSKSVIWQLLSKYKMKHRDPKLFFLTLEVVIQKPGRDGLTKKTLVLDDDSKPAELKNCNPWGECRFVLQQKKGGVVKVHDSILMEESQYKCLFISEETTVEEVINILLHCYGLEKVERAERYCMYEQCTTQRYHRKLHHDERPLHIQGLWHGPTQFCFVLKRSPLPVTSVTTLINDPGWVKQQHQHHRSVQASRLPRIPAGYPPRTQESGYTPRMEDRGYSPSRAASVESRTSMTSSDQESWPECDKDTEEHISGGDTDMDTSISSNDSPIPPPPPSVTSIITSTPLHESRNKSNTMPKPPPMSFLFPSPDYASFPNSLVPSRPYSSMSGSSVSLSSTSKLSSNPSPPSLPPKPASLGTLVTGADKVSQSKPSPGSFHDYENYFFI